MMSTTEIQARADMKWRLMQKIAFDRTQSPSSNPTAQAKLNKMPSEWSRRRQAHARKTNAELFEGTPFRPAHQHGERAKRKGKRKAAADGQDSGSGSSDEDDL
jgi:hypothetical protein